MGKSKKLLNPVARRMITKSLVIGLAMAAVVLVNSIPVHACPGCAVAMNGSVGWGFNLSIMFMMAMPFVVVGSIAAGLIYVYRRAAAVSSDHNSVDHQITQKEEKEN